MDIEFSLFFTGCEYYHCNTHHYLWKECLQYEAYKMSHRRGLTIDRDIEDVKAHVKREIETIRDMMDGISYRNTPPGWTAPFQLHRLRRAMRIHYLALKIRDTTPVPSSMRQLAWEMDSIDEHL